MVVAFGGVMLFLFVPETFWDRTPVPRARSASARPNFLRRLSSRYGDSSRGFSMPPVPAAGPTAEHEHAAGDAAMRGDTAAADEVALERELGPRSPRSARVEFIVDGDVTGNDADNVQSPAERQKSDFLAVPLDTGTHQEQESVQPVGGQPPAKDPPSEGADKTADRKWESSGTSVDTGTGMDRGRDRTADPEKAVPSDPNASLGATYTTTLRHWPAQTFVQQLRIYNGRLVHDNWFRVMLRPFVLFCYPAILWSAAVYSCSVGWLIVISESMTMIYRDPDSYNFDALQTGLVYLSPFIGGLLGTAVAGKVSDIVVKAMSRRNGGLYEPEFRLVMAFPILITTVIGLMGFGWSAEERNHWIVPTIFFGVISFGCSLGSTTAITFCVDSYRQYAGEALVTLNFSKNILHGLVFSLFFTHWLSADGSKMVFVWTGIIQLILLLTSVPLFIYGKRLRMWTVRKNMIERLEA
jgi:hypothetical protein